MRSAKLSNSGQSFKILLFFCCIVLILIVLASLFKIAAIISRSSFDGQHRFSIAYIGKPMQILSFAPDADTVSILEFEAAKPYEKKQLEAMMHIPIDAYIVEKKDTQTFHGEDPKGELDSYLQQLLFSFHSAQTDLTIVDVFRLWLFSQSVEATNVFEETLDKPIEKIESGALDKAAASYFSDSAISEENKSIQIINGTGVAGVGNEFAQMVSNMGGNVISVTTSNQEVTKTTIEYTSEKNTYTVRKLEKILQIKSQAMLKPRMFDVIITIGRDRADLFKK